VAWLVELRDGAAQTVGRALRHPRPGQARIVWSVSQMSKVTEAPPEVIHVELAAAPDLHSLEGIAELDDDSVEAHVPHDVGRNVLHLVAVQTIARTSPMRRMVSRSNGERKVKMTSATPIAASSRT
jgi:hypothetical protein